MNRLTPNSGLPTRFFALKIGAQTAPLVGYLFETRDNSVMSMPKPRTCAPASRSAEVETVRLFTASGHPWMGLVALAMWRFRWPSALLAALAYAKHAVF